MRDQGAVDEHVHRLAGILVEGDDRALDQRDEIAYRDVGRADSQRHVDRDVENQVEIDVGRGAVGALLAVGEFIGRVLPLA